MSLNPDTLQEESDEERRERQARTGVIGTGTMVWCRPYPIDPTIAQAQHRSVCLQRPYPACPSCMHSTFTLIFKSQPSDPYEIHYCPRWERETSRMTGAVPDTYVPVERALCYQKPFPFCPSCPSADLLSDIGADKVRPGWYGRWKRFTKGDDSP